MIQEDTKQQLEENNKKNCTCLIIAVVVMLGLYFVFTSSNKGNGQKGGATKSELKNYKSGIPTRKDLKKHLPWILVGILFMVGGFGSIVSARFGK